MSTLVQHRPVTRHGGPHRTAAVLALHLLAFPPPGDHRWDTGSLSAAELARVRSYPDPVRRSRAEASRLLVRAVLAETLGCPPADVPLTVTAHGRPVLAGEETGAAARPGHPLPPGTLSRFSVSHDSELLVVADSPAGCGVDVEDTDPALLHEVAARFCALAERASGLDALSARVLFTAKESVVKAFGLGLPAGLATITFAGDPAGGWTPARRHGRATGLLTRVHRYGNRHLAVTVRTDRPPTVTVTHWRVVPTATGWRPDRAAAGVSRRSAS